MQKHFRTLGVIKIEKTYEEMVDAGIDFAEKESILQATSAEKESRYLQDRQEKKVDKISINSLRF